MRKKILESCGCGQASWYLHFDKSKKIQPVTANFLQKLNLLLGTSAVARVGHSSRNE